MIFETIYNVAVRVTGDQSTASTIATRVLNELAENGVRVLTDGKKIAALGKARSLQSALEFALRQWKAYAELEDNRRLGEGDTAEDSLYRTFKSILDDYTDGVARGTFNGRPDAKFDRIRALLVRYAARLQDKNEEPPGPHLVAFAMLQAVDLLDVLKSRQ